MSAKAVKSTVRKFLLAILKRVVKRKRVSIKQMKRRRIKRVLVIPKFPELSSVVMTTPIIRGLRTLFPEVELTLIVKQGFEALFAGTLPANSILQIDYPLSWSFSGFARIYRLVRRLRQSYDMVFVITSNRHHLRQAILAQFANCKYVVGVKTDPTDNMYDFFYNLRIEGGGLGPLERKALAIVNNLSGMVLRPHVELPLTTAQLEAAVDSLSEEGVEAGSLILAIHFGPLAKKQGWATEKMVEVARHFSKNNGAQIALFGTPREIQSERFLQGLPFQPLDFRGACIDRVASILHVCDAAICSDFGFLYLTASQRRPLVWITNDKGSITSKPVGDRFVALEGIGDSCDSVHEDQVIRCVEELLAKYPKNRGDRSDFDISEAAVDDYLNFGDIRESSQL